jgi:5-methylcytosine-specific restriction endonuclease McrA
MRGKPLMPTSPPRARKLLKAGKARVARREPFTIRMMVPTGETLQSVTLGMDCGYRHVGLSATTQKEELIASEVELRDDVSKLLSDRLELRRSRRNRKTRYRAPRFDNRVHSKNKGWLAPSVENRIQAHLSRVRMVQSILPVSRIVVETASFDTQLLKNPDISGVQYQQGEQLGFWNVREYVLFRDGHRCCHCHGRSGDPILNVHHIESRKTGGDAPNNLMTLCETCHRAYHSGKIELKAKRGKSLRPEAFMGIMRRTVLERLREGNPGLEVQNTYGYITKHTRIANGIAKSHCADAYCIAGNLKAVRRGEHLFQKQMRKHNRQIHKLTILKDGVRKRHQAPYEVRGFRLFDKVLCQGQVGFIFGRRSSGYFDIRRLDGTRISTSARSDRLRLVNRKTTFLTEVRRSSPA